MKGQLSARGGWRGRQGLHNVGAGGSHHAFGLKLLGFSTGHDIRGFAGRPVRDREWQNRWKDEHELERLRRHI